MGGISQHTHESTQKYKAEGTVDAASNNPEEFLLDGAALNFAKEFDKTGKSDTELGRGSEASVGLDYETRGWTKYGYIEVDGDVTYEFSQGHVEVSTDVILGHGGMNRKKREDLVSIIQGKAEDAIEEYASRQEDLNLEKV